jgi:lathosterol oxidase
MPAEGKIPGWNYTPDVPLKVLPFFIWPLRPKNMLVWVVQRWFGMAENAILTFVCLITWYCFQPSLETTRPLNLVGSQASGFGI